MTDNADFRFGSAAFATEEDVRHAQLFTQQPNSLFIGFLGKRKLWYSDMGGLILIAGARSGKLRDILGYNLCAGTYLNTLVTLDMKGELAAISRNQTPDKKFCTYWNPAGLHDLPQNRLNPVDYIHIDSPTLVSDTKVFVENAIPLSGSANALYFERRAQELAEAISLTLTELHGTLTLPDLYHTINLIAGGGEEWLNFAFEMSRSQFRMAQRVEEEIAASRDSSSNGFQGIMGELLKSFACLSDPILMASVSPPYDFSLAQLCESDQAYQFYMMPPAEFIDAWSPVIKSLFVGAMIYKSRKPQSPQQTWILDECAQLGAFPLAVKLFTYGAGIGIRPWAIFQSSKQMNKLGKDAENIITSSAALRSYFGVRDLETARTLSAMIGAETLEFQDAHKVAAANHAKQQALHAFMTGNDLIGAGLNYAHHKKQAEMPSKQHRLLRTPDELLNMPLTKQYIFTDSLSKVLYADRAPYYEQYFMAGRYHPNPYHPPPDKVRVKTRFGYEWRRVIQKAVPEAFKSYPQYQTKPYSVIR